MKRTRVEADYLTEFVESFETVVEAAQELGIHPGSVGTYVRDGKCPPVVEKCAQLLLEREGDVGEKMLIIRCDDPAPVEAFCRALGIRWTTV